MGITIISHDAGIAIQIGIDRMITMENERVAIYSSSDSWEP